MTKDERCGSLTSQESYAAVIIADMVAEVPISQAEVANIEAKRKSSIPKSPKNNKEMNNVLHNGPMDCEVGLPPKYPLDSKEQKTIGTENDVYKGVILNASHIPSLTDGKIPFSGTNGFELTINTKNVGGVENSSDPTGKEEEGMSLMRKIAFGFSFLPSIFFVLCFAIILPCEEIPIPEPCVQEIWSITLNDTSLTTSLSLPEDLIFTYSNDDVNIIASLNRNTGTQIWNATLNSETGYIDCDKLDWNLDGIKDCLVMDNSGYLYVFNTSNGKVMFEQIMADKIKIVSLPTILPKCNTDNASTIALGVSKSNFQIGPLPQSLEITIPPCEAVPTRLMPWTRNETTDLLYYCRGKDDGAVMKLPQDEWCTTKAHAANILLLMKSKNLEDALILPTDNDLIIWTADDVFMINPDGMQSWEVSTSNHSTERRFLKYGKFIGKENQVALFSSDRGSNLQITTLNPIDGNITWTKSMPKAEISDVQLLSGKENDFILMVIQKRKTDLTSEAVERLKNGVTSTITNFLSNDGVNGTSNILATTATTIIQEINLIQLGNKYNLHTLQEKEIALDDLESSEYPTVTTAVNVKGNILTIVLTSSTKSTSAMKTTQLRGITVENWDITSPKTCKKE